MFSQRSSTTHSALQFIIFMTMLGSRKAELTGRRIRKRLHSATRRRVSI